VAIDRAEEPFRETPAESAVAYSFAPFRLFPAQRTLLKGDAPVRLGSRALDILIHLVEHAGSVVGKDELMARVWPEVSVDEGSLRTHIGGLRRALGDGQDGRRYVVNVPGRGYSFLAAVSRSSEPVAAGAASPIQGFNDLPASLIQIVGRDEIVDALVEILPKRRFVTIVGPGGIGKTTVALGVANRLASAYPDGVRFVDLAPIADTRLVLGVVGSTLGLTARSGDVLSDIVTHLRGRRMLLVLDNAEHVLDGTAPLAEAIFRDAPEVHILATSREPLRAEGEWVRRLPALAVPPSSAATGAKEALSFPAIELFVERATANLDSFELTDSNTPIVAETCRKLDGIPLAIELAAGRIGAFGLAGLAAALDDRFKLTARGRRTATPRHRTMSATLDWSYQWLGELEQAVLRRLAIFAGRFKLNAALAVLADVHAGPDAVEALANLVDKSLVTADVGGPNVVYRLLNTTRAYGVEKLREGGEFDDVARRHAEYYLKLFDACEADWDDRPLPDWLGPYAAEIDNLRAALDWTFSPSGDPSLGVVLTISAAPLWFQLSLPDECHARMDQALSHVDAKDAPRARLQLLAIRSWELETRIAADPKLRGLRAAVLDLAERLEDYDHQAFSLWGLWASHFVRGEKPEAIERARKFRDVAVTSDDAFYLAKSDRIFATMAYHAGNFAEAREHLDRAFGRRYTPARRAQLIRRRMEQHNEHRSMRALVLFHQGFLDQAMRVEDDNFAFALGTGNVSAELNFLSQSTCFVALYVGDVARAETYVGRFVELCRTYNLAFSAVGECFAGILMHLRGEAAAGLSGLRSGTERLRGAGYTVYAPLIMSNLAERLGEIGEFGAGFAMLEEAFQRTKARADHWLLPELLRIRGRIACLAGKASEAERDLADAIDLADRQGALLWELRAARTLAILRQAQGRVAGGRDVLQPVYDRFTEGFESIDMRAAKRLLDDLARQVPVRFPKATPEADSR